MVFPKYKYNEDKQFNKKIKKEIEDKTNNIIQLDINKFFEEEARGGIRLLDRMPHQKRDVEFPLELLEQYTNSKRFSAITMTFKPFHHMNLDELKMKILLKNTINSICFNHQIPVEILLLPDCDENGNFHYHGVIDLPNKYRPTFKRLITKFIGFMKFDYISNPSGWYEYVIKPEKKIYTEEEVKIYTIRIKL